MKILKLTDTQQAFFMLLVFVLPSMTVWFGLGMPTDRTALGLLGAGIVSGILAFIKELLGWKPSEKKGKEELAD